MRPAWTLWAYILVELWKLVFLTTAVLVTVIAFAAVIKPLADGKLDPIMGFRFMLLATVAMLQYALPFAACFAATLAYYRVSSDNELTAAYAGGVSHRSLLAPAALSGVILSLVLLALSQQVIPRFLRGMAELVTADAAQYVQSQITRGQSVEVGRTLIHADKVIPARAPEGFRDAMVLLGLLVVRLDESGNIAEQLSASSAGVWSRTRIGSAADGQGVQTELIVKPKDVVADTQAMRGASDTGVFRLYIPTDLRDNPKFLTWGELNTLYSAPEQIDVIERHRRELAQSMAEGVVVERLRAALRETGRADLRAGDERLLLRGARLRPVRTEGKIDPRVFQIMGAQGQNVVVERTGADGRQQRQTAGSAVIRFGATAQSGGLNIGPGGDDPDSGSEVRFTLLLRGVALERVGPEPGGKDDDGPIDLSEVDLQPAPGEAKERRVSGVRLADDPSAQVLRTPTWSLLEQAEKRAAERPINQQTLGPRIQELRSQVDDLLREVVSKQHERYAHSAACFVMLMLGAIMAMRLRDALPLTIYLWAFFPALATILAISGGQQLAHGKGAIGLTVLYSGLALLSGLAVVQYLRLARH